MVRSKLYPVERKVGSSRHVLICQVRTSIRITDTSSGFVTKSAYKINHNFNCNSKCLIYLRSCKTCGKKYTSRTVDKFRIFRKFRIITNRMLQKQLVVTWKVVNNNFFKTIFCRMTIMDF